MSTLVLMVTSSLEKRNQITNTSQILQVWNNLQAPYSKVSRIMKGVDIWLLFSELRVSIKGKVRTV